MLPSVQYISHFSNPIDLPSNFQIFEYLIIFYESDIAAVCD